METGCKYHDDCLTCPFPECIEGDEVAYLRWKASRLVEEGLMKPEIAKRLNKSERTIQRYLAER